MRGGSILSRMHARGLLDRDVVIGDMLARGHGARGLHQLARLAHGL